MAGACGLGGTGSLFYCGVDVCHGLGVGWARGVCFGIRVGGYMVSCVTGLHFPCGERWACDLVGLLRSVWVPGGGWLPGAVSC